MAAKNNVAQKATCIVLLFIRGSGHAEGLAPPFKQLRAWIGERLLRRGGRRQILRLGLALRQEACTEHSCLRV